MDELGMLKVSIDSNTTDLLDKIKRLQQLLVEAETLKQEISEFKIEIDIKN